jgi:hypothetical protein
MFLSTSQCFPTTKESKLFLLPSNVIHVASKQIVQRNTGLPDGKNHIKGLVKMNDQERQNNVFWDVTQCILAEICSRSPRILQSPPPAPQMSRRIGSGHLAQQVVVYSETRKRFKLIDVAMLQYHQSLRTWSRRLGNKLCITAQVYRMTETTRKTWAKLTNNERCGLSIWCNNPSCTNSKTRGLPSVKHVRSRWEPQWIGRGTIKIDTVHLVGWLQFSEQSLSFLPEHWILRDFNLNQGGPTDVHQTTLWQFSLHSLKCLSRLQNTANLNAEIHAFLLPPYFRLCPLRLNNRVTTVIARSASCSVSAYCHW